MCTLQKLIWEGVQMAVTPLSPGVYVREAPGGPRAIEGAPTAVAIFVGETERGPLVPTSISGKLEYQRLFGGYFRHRTLPTAPSKVFMPYATSGFFDNGGPRCYVLRVMDITDGNEVANRVDTRDENRTIIEASSPGIWGNSVSVAINSSLDEDSNHFRMVVFYQAPGQSSQELVEKWEGLSIDPSNENYVVDVLYRSNYIRWAEDVPGSVPGGDNATDQTDAAMKTVAVNLVTGRGGGDTLGTAVYGSLLDTDEMRKIDDAALLVNASDRLLPGRANDAEYMTISNSFINYVENQRPQLDLFFVGDLPPFSGPRVTNLATAARDGDSVASNFCGMYWPHIRIGDPVGQGANPEIVIPPAGHIAGLYGRTDGRRGVWKAPAGVDLRIGGARGFDFDVLETHQDRLNPLGVNALRQIPGAGLVVWGARTREPSSQWRYISVRRTAMFLRKSIYNGIQWAVFEPNDEPLWASLRATIGAFMETQFRNGAFAGATSGDAYFVKCDAETTTEADQIAGIVNILVGFAPLRPAEFVIVTLSQKSGQQA